LENQTKKITMKKIIDLIKSLLGSGSIASKAIAMKELEVEVVKEVADVKEAIAPKKKKKNYPAQPKKVK